MAKQSGYINVRGHPNLYITHDVSYASPYDVTINLHYIWDDSIIISQSATAPELKDAMNAGYDLMRAWIKSDEGRKAIGKLFPTKPKAKPEFTARYTSESLPWRKSSPAKPAPSEKIIPVVQVITMPAIIEALEKQASLLSDSGNENIVWKALDRFISKLKCERDPQSMLLDYRDFSRTLQGARIRPPIKQDIRQAMNHLIDAARASDASTYPELAGLATLKKLNFSHGAGQGQGSMLG